MIDKKYPRGFLVLISGLILLTFYAQTSGLLGLNRDGINYFLGILNDARPSFYDDARRFSHYFSQIFFVSAFYAGIRNIHVLAQIYSANLFLLPVLPFLYFLWKAKTKENLIGIPLLFLTYFYNFNSLNVISESVFAGALFIILCGMIHYMDKEQTIWEKVLLFWLMCITFRVYGSFIFFLPILAILLFKKYDSEYKWYFRSLFLVQAASFVFNIYTTITYQFSEIPLNSIIPGYIHLTQAGMKLYFPMGLLSFVVIPLLAFLFERSVQRIVKNLIIGIVALSSLGLIYLAIENLSYFRWSYINKLSNIYFPLFLSLFFFIPDRKFLSGKLVLFFVTVNLALSVFLSFNFKSRTAMYYQDLEIKCSQDQGLDTSEPDDSKGQFITEYFALIPDSILACAFAGKPVKTFSLVPGKSHKILIDVYKPSTYPNLSQFGVSYDVKKIKAVNQ